MVTKPRVVKVLLVQNEQPVETLRADSAHEPLGHSVGLRGANRRANDFDPVTPEHLRDRPKTGSEPLT